MPFDSQGKFTRMHNWEQDRINDIDIVTDHADEEDDNFAEALNETFLRDGRVAMKGDINMGGYRIKNLGDAVSNSDVVTKTQMQSEDNTVKSAVASVINALQPVGDIKASVKNANHGKWLLCNGQAVSRTTYSELFAVIGTQFGSGNGTTTFNVPDYRGKFLRGLGGNSAANIYTTQAEGLPNISGQLQASDGYGSGDRRVLFRDTSGAFTTTNASSSFGTWDNSVSKTAASKLNFSAANSNSIYGASSHVTPINQAVNYFIKAKSETVA